MMQISYTKKFDKLYDNAPQRIKDKFDDQADLLLKNLLHPSIRAKKYDVTNDIWQGRVTGSWRFYFKIIGNEYVMLTITPHP